jgi:phosphate acyltransferase
VIQHKIAIDVMGGDHGPSIVVPAALQALAQYDNLIVILVGDKALIDKQLEQSLTQPEPRCLIQHTSQQVDMDEAPEEALWHKTDSSMRVALELIKKGEADACISAGNTGALVVMACTVLQTIPGIDRPAISAVLPTSQPNHCIRLLDLGANANTQVEQLFQFAVMGHLLSQKVDQVISPKLALLNIGAEPNKGNYLLRQAGEWLSKKSDVLNYTGYIEADALFNGRVDVIVCDGFSGNIALKAMEGVINLIQLKIKQAFTQNGVTRLTGGIIRPILKQMEHKFNVNIYNGASLVGLQGIVVKSHGKANIEAFNYAIQKTIAEIQHAVPKMIASHVSKLLSQ